MTFSHASLSARKVKQLFLGLVEILNGTVYQEYQCQCSNTTPFFTIHQKAARACQRRRTAGEDWKEPGGISDLDYVHSISPEKRESSGPDGAIQAALA